MDSFDPYSIAGIRIVVSTNALEETDERLFPVSRHRSRRVHKKLVKRFGGEFRKVPCAFKTPQGIVMHPAVYAKLKQELNRMNAALTPPSIKWLSLHHGLALHA